MRGDIVTLLESGNQAPPSKVRRYVILGLLTVLFITVALPITRSFVRRAARFKSARQTVGTFLNAVVAGDFQQAYELWQPAASYTLKDFQDDWGLNGYYGPVKSFEVDSAFEPRKSDSDVAVRVLVSPYQPFPNSDPVEQSKTKSVTIWVNSSTHSLSTGPPGM